MNRLIKLCGRGVPLRRAFMRTSTAKPHAKPRGIRAYSGWKYRYNTKERIMLIVTGCIVGIPALIVGSFVATFIIALLWEMFKWVCEFWTDVIERKFR